MSLGWVLIGALVFGCLLGAFVVMALRRAVRTATGGQPTPAEAQIHAKAAAARAALPTPSAAKVHAMSDKELEDAANDRSPLAAPRK